MAVLLIELNEATAHFVERFVAEGKLPHFSKMRAEGTVVRTHIPGVAANDPRFTRKTSPWIVWPSLYTGLRADAHELLAFGQDTHHLVGKYLWDVLGAAGLRYGIFGSLNSFPPRPDAAFYVPESLADTADCIPQRLCSLQKFFLFGAHHYSESSLIRFLPAAWALGRASGTAVSLITAAQAFAQLPLEFALGEAQRMKRAMLHSILVADAFTRIYRRTRPDFATVHFNHVAYYQHRYWRAREPERFKRELSSTDRRFYRDVGERERDEVRYGVTIDRAYVWSDDFIGRMMDMLAPGDTLLLASGLSQRPYDPAGDIHNPVVRFVQAERFFAALGMDDVCIHYEMNPDLTLSCAGDARAADCESIIRDLVWDDGSPLFYCQRRRHQIFLEFDVPPRVEQQPDALIRHRSKNDFRASGRDHIWQSPHNEQSTAHHDEQGLLYAWRKGTPIKAERSDALVTEIAPAILAMFGMAPCAWHADAAGPLFDIR